MRRQGPWLGLGKNLRVWKKGGRGLLLVEGLVYVADVLLEEVSQCWGLEVFVGVSGVGD